MTWLWLALAILAGWGLAYCVNWALRPKPGEWHPYPDWFWGGSVGLVHGDYEEFKPEQSDRPESKPTSGAG